MLPPSPAHTRASWKGVVQWRKDEEGRGGWLWWWGDWCSHSDEECTKKEEEQRLPPQHLCAMHLAHRWWFVNDGMEERKCLSEYTKECSEREVKCSTSSHSPATERVCVFYKYCPPNSEKDDLNHTLQHSLNQPWGLYYKAGSTFPGFLSYLVQAILTEWSDWAVTWKWTGLKNKAYSKGWKLSAVNRFISINYNYNCILSCIIKGTWWSFLVEKVMTCGLTEWVDIQFHVTADPIWG